MLVVWKVTFVLVGLCCCCVSTVQHCACIDHKTCTARNGAVSTNSMEGSTIQCRGQEVMCCGTHTEDASMSVSNNIQSGIQVPRVASGGGCGRKRFPIEKDNIKGEKPPSETVFYGEAPWAVVILDKNLTLRCSGTLISPKVVLTAAHCLGWRKNSKNLFVRAGDYVTTITNKPLPSQMRSVHELVFHSDFDQKNIRNDIALIALEQPMELNAIVDVICIPDEGQKVIATECFVTGFGVNSKNDSHQPVLKKMSYEYKSQEYCLDELIPADAFKFYHETNICGVGDEENSPNQGVGGGPLFCPSQADPNKMVQIGIVSWLVKSEEKFPLVFTSVQHYLPWLREKLKELS